jgi:spore maturation protein SpmA
MALNYIWIGFFLVAFIVALAKFLYSLINVIIETSGNPSLDFSWELVGNSAFPEMLQTLFSRAELGFELSIGLTGILALWMGIMKIGEKGGAIAILSRWVSPLFTKLFPEIPKNHPAIGSMMMNFSANMLGLDNAATPLGLKAMDELQTLNPKKDTASNAQIMFLVLNTSGLTLIPVSIMALRASNGAANPTDIFIPILLATFCSSMIGLIVTSIVQKINLFNKVVFAYLGSAITLIGLLVWYISSLGKVETEIFSNLLSSIILFSIIISFLVLAIRKKINLFNTFIDGAKDGFNVAIKIIPYLIAMLCAIGVFTASGAMGYFIDGVTYLISSIGIDTGFVEALPTAIMKPLSGGGARGAMVETWAPLIEGGPSRVDSFAGKVASVLQGSTETTFYVLAVYFGAVKIKNIRYAATVGIIADIAGIIAAIVISYMFFT